MLFNTEDFARFFAVVFALYWVLRKHLRAQNVLLLASAYYFYACWEPRFLVLLIASTVMDYACGIAVDRIEDSRKRKAFVALSMVLNLGMLGYFKYYNFFAESLQSLTIRLGVPVQLSTLKVVLPIGISFYTFQSMSYVIDVYRREIKPTRNLIHFATFVSFFPHLVAGPIMRPTSLLPQVERHRVFSLRQFYEGVYLIFWGLTKKVVVADNLAIYVNDLFGRWETLDGGSALLAIYAFAFQIYCDFSGYTDAARGIAKCLGFELSLNFNLPYFATSPKDFWSRWHISLSSWLRDYLYIPLGGNRGGRWRVYRNLMLTKAIGGLWHGAAWTFVLWGVFHGVILVLHRMCEPILSRIQPADAFASQLWKVIRIVITFHLVCLGWLLFRASTLEQAWGMLYAIAARPALPPSSLMLPIVAVVLPLLVMQLAQYASKDLSILFRSPWYVRSAVYAAMFYAFVLAGEFAGEQFLYFQF